MCTIFVHGPPITIYPFSVGIRVVSVTVVLVHWHPPKLVHTTTQEVVAPKVLCGAIEAIVHGRC